MTPPRRANIGAAMITHRTEHAWLQVVEGHVVQKADDVQFGVVMTVRIAATDEYSVST